MPTAQAVLALGRRRAAGLSPLGREGAAGAGAGRIGRAPSASRSPTTQLALACASHGGEPAHVATALGMLAARRARRGRIGMRRALADAPAVRAGAGARRRERLGPAQQLLRQACRLPVRRLRARRRAARLRRARPSGAARGEGAAGEPRRPRRSPTISCAIDDCSVPTWALPLDALALAFARFGTGQGLAPARAAAAARLRAACAAHPWHVAGTGRFCTDVMGHFGARVFVKTGAEGVFCGALPARLGIAIKCDDGAGRAAEVAMAAVIARLLPLGAGDRALIDRLLRPTLRTWNGVKVGRAAAGGGSVASTPCPLRRPATPPSSPPALRPVQAAGSRASAVAARRRPSGRTNTGPCSARIAPTCCSKIAGR